MVTGNTFEGAVVSHSRNWGLQSSGSDSKIFSNSGMNEAAKWQFCKNTHCPRRIDWLIACLAISPCPWPRDLIMRLELILFLMARVSTSTLGSAPGDRMNISGW